MFPFLELSGYLGLNRARYVVWRRQTQSLTMQGLEESLEHTGYNLTISKYRRIEAQRRDVPRTTRLACAKPEN